LFSFTSVEGKERALALVLLLKRELWRRRKGKAVSRHRILKKMTTKQRVSERYAAGNLEAAYIILADPVKYPPESLPTVWARLVLERAIGPLFERRAA
jgi:hypothetical protein